MQSTKLLVTALFEDGSTQDSILKLTPCCFEQEPTPDNCVYDAELFVVRDNQSAEAQVMDAVCSTEARVLLTGGTIMLGDVMLPPWMPAAPDDGSHVQDVVVALR